MRRRSFLLAGLAYAPLGLSARLAPGGPLRLGADVALVESGLAGALQRAFARDTGIPVQIVPAPVVPLLEALVAGELDAGLTNAPDAELPFEKDGLVYGRRPIANGEFVLVGPRPGAKARHGAAEPAGSDIAAALIGLRDRAANDAALPNFVSTNDGSGAAMAEAAAWRRAGIAPQAPWYQVLPTGSSVLREARARGAYALVERGAWRAAGGAPLGILVEADEALAERVDLLRSFRSPHPAGSLFGGWIGDRRGRAVVAAHRGYRAPAP